MRAALPRRMAKQRTDFFSDVFASCCSWPFKGTLSQVSERSEVQISEEPEDSHLKWAHVCLFRVNGHSCARLLQMTEPDKSKVLHLQEGGSG